MNCVKMIPTRNPHALQRSVDAFNRAHPVGCEVLVIRDDGSTQATVTTSAAWVMGGHTAVIRLRGISGAYALSRVSKSSAPSAPPREKNS